MLRKMIRTHKSSIASWTCELLLARVRSLVPRKLVGSRKATSTAFPLAAERSLARVTSRVRLEMTRFEIVLATVGIITLEDSTTLHTARQRQLDRVWGRWLRRSCGEWKWLCWGRRYDEKACRKNETWRKLWRYHRKLLYGCCCAVLWLLWELIEDCWRCCCSCWWLWVRVEASWFADRRRWCVDRRRSCLLAILPSHLVLYTAKHVQALQRRWWRGVVVFHFGLNDIRCAASGEFIDCCRRRCSVSMCSHYHTDALLLNFRRVGAVRWVIGAAQIFGRWRERWQLLFSKVEGYARIHAFTRRQVRVLLAVGGVWCDESLGQVDWLQLPLQCLQIFGFL